MARDVSPTLRLLKESSLPMIASSVRDVGEAVLWLERHPRRLHLISPVDHALHAQFHGETEEFRKGMRHLVGPLSAYNAAAVRTALPNLQPRTLGQSTSAGFGDRLGLATPGHVRGLERIDVENSHAAVLPIFAQQSIREMTRTDRTPLEVIDDATWGALEAGWTGLVGADADHLKTTEHIDACVPAGFSFFTIDPGDFVDDTAADASSATLTAKLDGLPWDALSTTQVDLMNRYAKERIQADGLDLAFEREELVRAAIKYGAAIAHTAHMYRHLEAKGVPFELEVSVDETATPTTLFEHAFIALELERLGVRWISLAPRFVGRFEKGVDFQGDLQQLVRTLTGHAEIARALGSYKLSLHSGSDKFSVYGPIAEATRGLVHLKTAGTSYLEALRIAAVHDPELFRDILTLSREHFAEDRATYHISADLSAVPQAQDLDDAQLSGLLDDDSARQVLHVTFGSALDAFRSRLIDVLETHHEAHAERLADHFERHLRPFAEHARTTKAIR